jgi:hypothetical protein
MECPSILASLDPTAYRAIGALLTVAWQSSLMIAAAALALRLLRSQSAALRQAVWASAIVLIPLLPLAGAFVSTGVAPQAVIPVMPVYSADVRQAAVPSYRSEPLAVADIQPPDA